MRSGITSAGQIARRSARRAASLALALLASAGCGSDDAPAGNVEPMSCEQLAQAYGKALDEARRCDPGAAEGQCALPVDDAISCACRIHVKNSAASDRLPELAQAFHKQQCPTEPCAKKCAQPTAGVCAIKLGNLTEGRCENG